MRRKSYCTRQRRIILTNWESKSSPLSNLSERNLETGDTKPQGSATLKDTAFDIISLNDNAVLVEGKLYKKNEVVKIIRTDIEGIASTSADLLPYGKFRMNNEKSRNAGTGIFRSLFFLRP